MPLQSFRAFIALSAIIVLGFGSRMVLSALDDQPDATSQPAETPKADAPADAQPETVAPPEQPPAKLAEQSYAGTNQCFICHRPQTDMWSESKHAQAFEHVPESYRRDASCLKCHVTAFGQPSGYVSGTEKDLLMVGCESCHGPGALHIDAARRFVLATPDEEAKVEKEMRATIVKTPTDNVCIKCHVTQAHGHHPAYHGQPSRRVHHGYEHPLAGKPAWHFAGHSVKTCGSCHYDRYKRWGEERHSALGAKVPLKYRNDQECGKCHSTTQAGTFDSALSGDPHHQQIGAACESCHGGGREHVRFTMRYLSGPPLSPSQEQTARLSIRKAKPTTSCINCHIGQSHKPHPEFAKSG